MDAMKAGAHKVQEAVHGKKAEEKLDKATDPSRPASERVEHARDAAVSECKADSEGRKADCKANDHKH